MISLKRLAYCCYKSIHQAWWTAMGRRLVRAFGQRLAFTPFTEFPQLRGLRHPRAGSRSRIVGFADFVQMHACCRLLEDIDYPPVIVDVGAHHGVYAILAGSFAQKLGGRVIAIEPVRQNVNVLRRNIDLNRLAGTVIVEECAVVEKAHRVKVTFSGSQSTVHDGDCGDQEVEGVTLSDVLRRHDINHVDLLIVDCEGAELSVLRSLDWTSQSIGAIFCEMHPYNWPMFDYCGEDLSLFLKERGLRCLDMYFREWTTFDQKDYIGPCLLLSNSRHERIAPCSH